MSIWFSALIHLNPNHLDPKRDPIQGIKQVFKKHGKDFDAEFPEAEIQRVDKAIIRVSICNPEGYTEVIHKSLTDITNNLAYVQYVDVVRHRYS